MSHPTEGRAVLRGMDSNFRQIAEEALARGWVVDRTKRHVRLRHPSGAVVLTSATYARGRGAKNFAADLRRIEREAGAA
jgi:hypothetical protein